MSWQSPALALLEASLVRPLGLVAVAWLILRVFRVQHPASRHAVWSAVLAGMLVLPIISVVAPHWTVPVLPASRATEIAKAISNDSAVSIDDAALVGTPSIARPAFASFQASLGWPSSTTLIIYSYGLGLVAMVLYQLTGWVLLVRVIARSKILRPRCLRESADVVTPVAIGVLRPSVILPAGWREWNSQTKRMVLAHEFAHLRRRDTLVAGLARFVKCVFWFHPAAWWVSRQTSDLAELACDAVALERTRDPVQYSRLLLQFAEAVRRSRTRVALPGLAIATASGMSKRVDQVFEMSDSALRQLARPKVLLAAVGLPAICLASTVGVGARAPRILIPANAAMARTAGQAQTFEVVSIKPCSTEVLPSTQPGGRGAGPSRATTSPGRAHWDCVTVGDLLMTAYAGPSNRLLHSLTRQAPGDPKIVRGGPSWLDSDKFEIDAKASGDADRATLIGPMLRALLEDRFKLRSHRETEERTMYQMTVAKTGLKIKPIPADGCREFHAAQTPASEPVSGGETQFCGNLNMGWTGGNRTLMFTGIVLKNFAEDLLSGSIVDRFVIDKTGVPGRFTFQLEFAPDDATPGSLAALAWARRAGAETPTAPPIFKALEEQLGLKLESTRAPAEFLVIDHVERPIR